MKNFSFQEVALIVLVWIWAVWLLVFHSYEEAVSLEILRDWNIPKYLIIGWLFVMGVCLLLPNTAWRRQFHLLMSAFWFFIAFIIAQVDINAPSIPVYITIAVIHAGFGFSRN